MGDIVSFRPHHVLLVEDNPSESEFLHDMLSPSSYGESIITHVTTLEAALEALKEDSFHIVLLDLSLPDAVELAGLTAIQSLAPTLPVIILTALDSKELALKAVEEGAQDYLLKDDVRTQGLYRSISYAIQRKRFESGLIIQANYDMLTGLVNRALFESRLSMAFARTRRSQLGIGVFFLDLNKFKLVNDLYGHAVGDALLKEVGKRIKLCLRAYDTVARLGGDEFAILVEGIERSRDCVAVAQKIIQCLNEPFHLKARTLEIGVSIGISAYFHEDGVILPEHLLLYADEAMYRAKAMGISCYTFHSNYLQEELSQRTALERDLMDAMREDQLVLYYQPKISMQTGQTIGAEALVRWNHPLRGLLLPGEFTLIAEEIGLMPELAEWVVSHVCKDLMRWDHLGFSAVPVSINLSPSQLDDTLFLENVRTMLEIYDVSAEYLIFEIPESALLRNVAGRSSMLSEFKQLGIGIHLDRFGAAQIPLNALLHPALHALKIDFSEMANEEMNHPEFFDRIEAIMAIAKPLGLKIIASGIENRWQQSYLKEHSCDQAQGFAVARPMLSSDLQDWLNSPHEAVS